MEFWFLNDKFSIKFESRLESVNVAKKSCEFSCGDILEYDLLVVPGGVKALEKLRLEKGVVEFVREWNSLDKTIFSLCNGAQLLITADVIRGKTVSGYYAIEADINNAGATYHRGPVVVDSNIVSSPHYDFMGEWMRTGYEVLERRGRWVMKIT